MTDAEKRLWRALREALPEWHWRKQVPLGRYTADFCSHRAKFVIEVDGEQHAGASAYDATRTRFIEGEGYRVLRLWNHDVLENTEGAIETIANFLASPLVGEVGGGRRASARHETGAVAAKADESLVASPAKADDAPPPNPPHKGEGL